MHPRSHVPAGNGNKPSVVAELGNELVEEVDLGSNSEGLPAAVCAACCDSVAFCSKESGAGALSPWSRDRALPLATWML